MATDDTPYDSWARISEAQQYVPPPPYTATELEQLRSMNVPFRGVPNYRDVSMTDMAVCDTGLQMCRNLLYNHEKEILRKRMIHPMIHGLDLAKHSGTFHHHLTQR